MAETANRNFLKKCVAKICQNVGWNSIQATPLELLTDLLQEYITSLAKTAYSYALHCGNTEANITHLALAFKDMGVSISDLKEYVRYVDSSSISDVPKYPIPKENHLNLLKPGSREVVTRPFHIHEHLPPMHPHLEDQELSLKHSPLSIDNTSETSNPASSPKSKFKRPGDPLSDVPTSKRTRYCEEEDRPLRELSSVMMTTSGFLSPAREGKLPEARTPIIKTDSIDSSNDVKPEKKKKKLNPDGKKVEKDVKQTSEIEGESPKEEEKSKKTSLNKDPTKHKSKKAGTPKSSAGSDLSSNLSSKLQKKLIKKAAKSVSPQINSAAPSSKKPKIDKPVHQIKRDDVPIPSSNTATNSINLDYKLPSEPDKQKLNIFKKISKVKEESVEEAADKGEPENKDLSQIDITIESVIKREMVQADFEIPNETKDEVVDIETIQSPNPYTTLMSNNNNNNNNNNNHNNKNSLSSVTTSPLSVKSEKKKKKEKNKMKKESTVKIDAENSIAKPNNVSYPLDDHESGEDTLEPVVTPVSFNDLPTAPGLIPSTTSLVPSILGSISKSESNQNNQNPEPVKVPSVIFMNQNVPPTEPLNNSTTSISPNDSVNKIEDSPAGKKKEHKKDKKDKIKKKKKNKLKNKDKSEKKKLKLEKKSKLKDKAKQKKEKKEKRKEKEVEDGNDPTNGVTKITFKVGPAASDDNPNDSFMRKIVIKPIVKKDPEVVKVERAPSPELARFSPLIQIPKHKPKVQSSENTKVSVVPPFTVVAPSTPVEVSNGPVKNSSLPSSVKIDGEGNPVWICPGCERQDDGTPMIGCDGCDNWYHWVCVGIQVPPLSDNWFCNACLNKKKIESSGDKKKKSKKKNVSKKAKLDVIQ